MNGYTPKTIIVDDPLLDDINAMREDMGVDMVNAFRNGRATCAHNMAVPYGGVCPTCMNEMMEILIGT